MPLLSEHRRLLLIRLLVVAAPLLSLAPLARLVADWAEVHGVMGIQTLPRTSRGFDWVRWEDVNGQITATYVFPRGSAAQAGLQPGDVLYELDYHQYFMAEDVLHAIEGMRPGSQGVYTVQRAGKLISIPVAITRYPSFLYPLSASLWQFSIWAFIAAAYVHLLALVVVIPLARRSSQARYALLLIVVSLLWVFMTKARLLIIELGGPALVVGSTHDGLLKALSLLGLIGWLAFPALLFYKLLQGAPPPKNLPRAGLLFTFFPPVVLGVALCMTALYGDVGPITLDSLMAPNLFYATCYIAASAGCVILRSGEGAHANPLAGSWNRPGSIATLAVSVLFALFVLGIIPTRGVVTDVVAGWLVVAVQLLALAPVLLVSAATLKHGKLDEMIRRSLTYITVLALIFLAYVVGAWLLEPLLRRADLPRNLSMGAYVVVLLLVFERVARRMRAYSATFFVTERQKTRQKLNGFIKTVRSIMDVEALAQQTARACALAFGARWCAVMIHNHPEAGPCVAAYPTVNHRLNERVFGRIWPFFSADGRIWALNPELNEGDLPADAVEQLQRREGVIAAPIVGEARPIGLIVLGPKRRIRAVYNLEDVELLRSLTSQLALAVERLALIERERTLIRESAEAQLMALRAQINPHFLFNALNTIVSLISERPDQAEKVVEHLAGIFRQVLQVGSGAYVTLEEELRLVGHYLQIEQARFGDKLEVVVDFPPELRAALVPAFSVQTLVENAVKHGLERKRQGGRVSIRCARRADGAVQVEVEDTGAGIPQLFGGDAFSGDPHSFYGIGLRNVAGRLKELYGRADLLQLRSYPDEGVTATLVIPAPERTD